MTNYEVLSSKLRVKPTFTSAEEVIRKDFKLKLPDRRFIQIYNTPEISQYRGYQQLLDETEERKHVAAVTRLDIQQTARQTNEPSMNAEIVQEMMQNQRQSSAAMAQHMRDLAEHTRRENAGMVAEQRVQLQHLANAHAQAQNLQRISETALAGLMRDSALEQRNLIQDLAAKAGHVTNNIDSRHFETHNHEHTTNTTQMTDVNIHNQVQQMMQTHTQQIGVIMQQNQIGHEQMQQALYDTIRQQQQAQASVPPQVIMHMIPQAPPPMIIMPVQPPPGPPPPPAAGAFAIPVVPRPAPILKPEFIVKAPLPVPTPVPAPTIQPEEVIRRQQRELDSYNRKLKPPGAARVAPWNSGIANPPALPKAEPRAIPTLPPPIAAPLVLPEAPTVAPGAPVVLPTDVPQAPLPAAPVFPRGRAPRSLAAQSTRYAPTERTRDESFDTGRSRSRSAGPTLRAREPRVIRPKPLAKAKKDVSAMSILTPQANAMERKPKQVSFKKPAVEEVDGGDDKPPPPQRRRITKKEPPGPAAASVPKNRRTPIPRGVTTVSSKGVYSKIRVVPLESSTNVSKEEPKKRGRGRPKGSLGVKKRAVQK